MSIEGVDAISFNETTMQSLPIEEEKPFHYQTEFLKLVAMILEQGARTGQNDQKRIRELKHHYEKCTDIAVMQQTNASLYNLYGGVVACALSFFQFGMPNELDQRYLNLLSQQAAPNLASMFSTPAQATMQSSREKGQLKLEEYRNVTASKQSEGSTKQDYLQIIHTMQQAKKEASQAR